jgi:hypothetical protein
VVFESDSQSLVNSIITITNCKGNSEFSAIVASIRTSLSLLSYYEVKFVRRQANLVVHSLVRAANSMVDYV